MEECSCFFSVIHNFFLGTWAYFVEDWAKKLGTFLNAAKYLGRKKIWHLFPEKMLCHFSNSGGNLSNSEKIFFKKNSVFHFLSAEDFLFLFTRDLGFFWTVSLNIWASAERFSRIISKVHSRRGRQRPGFFLIPQKISLEPEPFLSKFGQKNSGSFLKTAKYVRRRTIWSFFREKMFFQISTSGGNFSTFEKNFSKKQLFLFFLCAEDILVLFTRDLGFFWTVSLNIQASAEKFSQVFSKMHSKCGRELSWFFWLLIVFLLGTWAYFVKDLAKKLGTFLNTAKKSAQSNKFLFLSLRNFFFQFSTLGVQLSVFERDFSKKILNCCFSCAEDIWYFFLKKICFFSDLGSKCFGVGQKCFGRSLRSAFKVCRKTFYLVFCLKNYHFSRTPNNFSSQFGKIF